MKRVFWNLSLVLALAVVPQAFAQEIKQRTIPPLEVTTSALALTHDSQTLYFGDKASNQLLLRGVQGTRIGMIGKHTAPFVSLAVSADGTKLLTLSNDKLVQLWDLGADKVIAKHKVATASGLVALTDEGKILLAYTAGGRDDKQDWVELRLLDVASGKQRVLTRRATPIGIAGISANIALLAMAADSKTLAFASTGVGGDYYLGLLNLSGNQTLKVPAGLGYEWRLVLPRGGSTLFVVEPGNEHSQIKYCNLATGKVFAQCKVPAKVSPLAAEGRFLVTVGPKNNVQLWEVTLPLELRLTAKKITYTLDLGGKTAAEFLQPLNELRSIHKSTIPYDFARKLPPCPTVELLLEIRNTGDQEFDIWVGGHVAGPPSLVVQGPGAFAVLCESSLVIAPAPPPQAAKKVTLASGKSFSFPIHQLMDAVSFARTDGNRFYWTAPGEYTVQATWQLAAGPKLPGGPSLTSNAVKLKVEAPKKIAPNQVEPARLKGMKNALADLDKGLLWMITDMPGTSPWGRAYEKLAQKECGIEFIPDGGIRLPAEVEGYNAVMLLEIEQRFGRGILDQFWKKARNDYRKAEQGK